MNKNIEKSIRSIPIWNENIKIQTIDGGLTNQNFLIGSLMIISEETRITLLDKKGKNVGVHAFIAKISF